MILNIVSVLFKPQKGYVKIKIDARLFKFVKQSVSSNILCKEKNGGYIFIEETLHTGLIPLQCNDELSSFSLLH